MLKQVWTTREWKTNSSSTHPPASTSIDFNPQDPEQSTPYDSFSPSRFFDSLSGENGTAEFSSIKDVLGSFMPEVAGFSTSGFEEELAQQYPLGGDFQVWGLCHNGTKFMVLCRLNLFDVF